MSKTRDETLKARRKRGASRNANPSIRKVRRVDKPRELTSGKGKDVFRSELEARASRTRAKTLREPSKCSHRDRKRRCEFQPGDADAEADEKERERGVKYEDDDNGEGGSSKCRCPPARPPALIKEPEALQRSAAAPASCCPCPVTFFSDKI